jgi:hypothetical protein
MDIRDGTPPRLSKGPNKPQPGPLPSNVVSASAALGTTMGHNNPTLPIEVGGFSTKRLEEPSRRFTEPEWITRLHNTEVTDKRQQVALRWIFSIGVFTLLIGQNVGIWFLVVWALNHNALDKLQFVFSTLIAGSLLQSYEILKFITNKVFSPIDYHNESDDS